MGYGFIDGDRLMEWIQDISWKGRVLTVPDIRFICDELAKDRMQEYGQLIDFVQAQEADKGPHTLGERLNMEILKCIISGDARMSGCATNHKNKRMYVEYSFYEKSDVETQEEGT